MPSFSRFMEMADDKLHDAKRSIFGSSKAKLYGLQEQQVFAVPEPEMMQKAKSGFSHLYSDILVC